MTLFVVHLRDDPDPGLTLPVAVGIAAAVAVLASFFVYQHHRYQRMARTG